MLHYDIFFNVPPLAHLSPGFDSLPSPDTWQLVAIYLNINAKSSAMHVELRLTPEPRDGSTGNFWPNETNEGLSHLVDSIIGTLELCLYYLSYYWYHEIAILTQSNVILYVYMIFNTWRGIGSKIISQQCEFAGMVLLVHIHSSCSFYRYFYVKYIFLFLSA